MPFRQILYVFMLLYFTIIEAIFEHCLWQTNQQINKQTARIYFHWWNPLHLRSYVFLIAKSTTTSCYPSPKKDSCQDHAVFLKVVAIYIFRNGEDSWLYFSTELTVANANRSARDSDVEFCDLSVTGMTETSRWVGSEGEGRWGKREWRREGNGDCEIRVGLVQGSFRAGTHRNAVPVLFLITGTPFRSFSAYSCNI